MEAFFVNSSKMPSCLLLFSHDIIVNKLENSQHPGKLLRGVAITSSRGDFIFV